MPKVNYITTNFTAGEFSPRLMGRVDIERYRNAAKTLRNCYPLVHGGVRRRGGTIFVGEAGDMTEAVRLVPFVKDAATTHMLEFGDGYVRVYKDGALVLDGNGDPYEIASPYVGAAVHAFDYAQDGDSLYIASGDLPIHRLRRYADATWQLGEVPFQVTPFAEVGLRVSVALTLSDASVGAGRTVTAAAATFLESDVGRAILFETGVAVITAYTSATVVTAEIKSAFPGTSITGTWTLDSSPQTGCTPSQTGTVGDVIQLTLDHDGWRVGEDVGKFVRINEGLVQIVGFGAPPTKVVNAKVFKPLANASKAPALAWTLEASVWNAVDKYPRTITFHEQRLIAGGSEGFPRTVWGSRTGEPFDFTLGTDDADAFAFTLASDESNRIAWVASARNLLVLTYGGEFSIQGGTEKPITPTNVRIRSESNHGATDARPVLVGRELVFVQRAGRKIRALAYQFDFDGYASPDLTVLAEHVTKAVGADGRRGVLGMAYQQEPDPLLWVWLADGRFLSCTLDRDSAVIGWARHETDGAVESMATIPGPDGSQVWLVVKREIAGQTVRYIERMDTHATALANDEGDVYGAVADCAVIAEGAASDTWPVAHLEGAEVVVVADGAYAGRQTVASGQITLARNATKVIAGLPFVPRIELLTPELMTQSGTAQGQQMSTSKIILRVLESGEGLRVNGQEVPFRRFGGGLLDAPPPVFTGDVHVSQTGWDRGLSDIAIEQPLPLPLHLLAVIRELTVNG